MSTEDILVLEHPDRRYAEIVLNRPDKRNALSFKMWEALPNFIHFLEKNEMFRAIVLRGAGRHAFSGGADISEFASKRDTLENTRIYRDTMNSALRSLRTVSKPVIAVIQGHALGGGCELAISADLRIASDNARLGIGAARLGVVISYSNLVRLIHTIGFSRSRKMLLVSETFSAEEALNIGLVDYVVSDSEME
jgi:enoyl-CoA hydratase/carnithine racemase